MTEREPVLAPTEEEIRAVVGRMRTRPVWRFTHWSQKGGENLLEVGNRVLCKVPMKYELEEAARHAVVACNALPWLVGEIDRLRKLVAENGGDLGRR